MQLPVYAADGFATFLRPVQLPFPFFVKGTVQYVFKLHKLFKKQLLYASVRVREFNADGGQPFIGLHLKKYML